MNSCQKISRCQKTLMEPAFFSGIGVHSGEKQIVKIYPAKPNHGIRINEVPALIGNAESRGFSTSVGDINTVEHLLAFLYLSGVTNADIRVIGPKDSLEVPILDGSSSLYIRNPFMCAFKTQNGFPTKSIRAIPRKFLVLSDFESDSNISAKFDHAVSWINISYFYQREIQNSVVQQYSQHAIEHNQQDSLRDIIHARTFCFMNDVKKLRESNQILGGSKHNALVLDEKGQPIDSSFRSQNELADHKILDFIGDLSLIGHQVIGLDVALYRSGHKLNLEFVRKLDCCIKNKCC